MAKIEKIGNIQVIDNKKDKFFYFPMISMACTGYRCEIGSSDSRFPPFLQIGILSTEEDRCGDEEGAVLYYVQRTASTYGQ